jgi:hypothetical protein
MERLSVSLDKESLDIINKYIPKYQGSKANIIRRALQILNGYEKTIDRISTESIEAYIEYLAKMEHLIIDIAHCKAIFTEIGEGSEKFWNEVYHIGEEHRKEFFDRGIKNIRDILKYFEKTNWYQLNIDTEYSYTLILTISESSKFIKTFFMGFFNNYSRRIEIQEEYKKIRIRVI